MLIENKHSLDEEQSMRLKSILGAMAAIMALALSSPKPVEASECYRCARADGVGHTRVVYHHAYYPRYAHVYASTDRYDYRYEPRGYYPYYNSGYWVPRSVYRREAYPYRLPTYYQAWGYPKSGYKHYEWHQRHHGGHWHHHW
jgi:hypothetical protein